MKPLSLFEKLWKSHVVAELPNAQDLLYIDRHFINEVTSPQAFDSLACNSKKIWRADSVLATADHNVPTADRQDGIKDELAKNQVEMLYRNCDAHALKSYPVHDLRQGILHVVGPELGATLPGMTIVCGDSHTSTHGAFATLAFGIGTSEIEHVLATQCLPMSKPKTMRIEINGALSYGVTAKDTILHVIGAIGTGGAKGYAVEYTGDTIRRLGMEGRMTICNMTIEAGARIGLIAVDETTLKYLKQRPFAPSGQEWDNACLQWQKLFSDPNANYDKSLSFDAREIRSMVTWGTKPDMVVAVEGVVPDPRNATTEQSRLSMVKALDYMGLTGGQRITDIALDKVFIGSCTNARLEDLRAAASIVKGCRKAKNVKRVLVVPGSGLVKKAAEQEGLDQIFLEAGFEWRQPGCSMCLGMNEDRLSPGERCASTSNRNFEGRQGHKGRSHLVSPQTAAAAAIAGHFVDVSKAV